MENDHDFDHDFITMHRYVDLHVLFTQVKIRRALPQSTLLGDSIMNLISLVEGIPSLTR